MPFGRNEMSPIIRWIVGVIDECPKPGIGSNPSIHYSIAAINCLKKLFLFLPGIGSPNQRTAQHLTYWYPDESPDSLALHTALKFL